MRSDCDCPECTTPRGRLARAWAWLEDEPKLFGVIILGFILGLGLGSLIVLAMRRGHVFPG